MKKRYTFLLQAWLFGITAHSCWAMEPEENRPAEHFCPITLQVMKDPVVASDGHSYERNAIQTHLQKTPEPISPITGLPVNKENLTPNQSLKSMIQDWKPGLQRGPSALENRSAEEISKQIRKEFSKNAALLNAAKDRHIVAFLGNTGAGKSTLVNLLSGKQLKVSADGEDYVLVDPSDSKAMPIGTEGGSETLYPKYIDVDELRLFDLPGFNDTDGSERNLINAAFIRKILLDAASVRLVFVAGQDQFTADRSASIRQMFNCLKQLFVVEQDTDLVDQGIFVATKVTCAPQTELTEFLLKKTNSNDKATLNEQLQSWSKDGRLARMFHPLRDSNNENVKEQIFDLIKGVTGTKIQGINVSALYPSDTQQDLERMFLNVLEEGLAWKKESHPVTLFDYDSAIKYYQAEDFWQRFERELCREDGAIAVLKDFCTIPYNKALRSFEQNNKGNLKTHIKNLTSDRQEREKDIEQRTEKRANEVIASLVPKKESDYFVTFDFAYHKDFYDQVCGPIYITELATNLMEQEAVRRHYAGFISLHSHMQMLRWHQKFSGTNDLIKQISTIEERIKILEAERVEEKKQITQAAEEERERQEREKLAQERLQKERVDQERERKEKERLAKEAEERQRIKLAAEQRERQERERLAREAEEKQRIQKEKEEACERRKALERCCKGGRCEGQSIYKHEYCSVDYKCGECVPKLSPSLRQYYKITICTCGACR